MSSVRPNDQTELMSINRELLGNSFIRVLFILLFVNQIICLTCGLFGLLWSFLSSAERGCWNSHVGRATHGIALCPCGQPSYGPQQPEVCLQLTLDLHNPTAHWALIDLLIIASCFRNKVEKVTSRSPGNVIRKQLQAESPAEERQLSEDT